MRSRHRGGTASAFNWVKRTSFRVPGVSRTAAKAIMFAIADYVDERWSTYAGQERVGGEAEVSARVVRRFFAGAEEVGYLCRDRVAEEGTKGRAGVEGRVYLHVDGSREFCPCPDDQAARSTEEDERPSGQMTGTKRPDDRDQAARSSKNAGGAPSSRNPGKENPEEPALLDPLPALYGVEHFWDAWPRRNGKKLYRGKAEDQWRRLVLEERKAAWRGAKNYAQASASGLAGAMDAFRWLRDRAWEDWQEPATPDAKPNGNGRPPRTPIADHFAMEFDGEGKLVR